MPAEEFPCADNPRTVHVHHADAPGIEPGAPKAALICIDTIQPRADYADPGAYAQAARDRFVDDARQIADVLYGHLPGGTLDALLAEMLTRRGTQLRVPLPAANGLVYESGDRRAYLTDSGTYVISDGGGWLPGTYPDLAAALAALDQHEEAN